MKVILNKVQKMTLLSTLTIASLNVYAGGERDPLLTKVLVDKFEISSQANTPTSWDATAWIGKDWHKLYLKSEGETVNGKTESENQLLYSHPVDKYWDIQAGLGFDTKPEHNQSWGIIGLQGLAPYFFETNADLLLNDKNIGLRLSTEYEALFTQRLILTPSIAIKAYTSDDSKMAIGSGLSSTDLSIRLRYEFNRKFAPYIGIKFNQLYGTTADYAKNEGGQTSEASVVAGLRFWF